MEPEPELFDIIHKYVKKQNKKKIVVGIILGISDAVHS